MRAVSVREVVLEVGREEDLDLDLEEEEEEDLVEDLGDFEGVRDLGDDDTMFLFVGSVCCGVLWCVLVRVSGVQVLRCSGVQNACWGWMDGLRGWTD
jgi:hypothetical protein